MLHVMFVSMFGGFYDFLLLLLSCFFIFLSKGDPWYVSLCAQRLDCCKLLFKYNDLKENGWDYDRGLRICCVLIWIKMIQIMFNLILMLEMQME